MQELVDENSDLTLEQSLQHTGRDSDVQRRYALKFGQIFLSKPSMVEADGTTTPLLPHEARLRNLTYSSILYVEIDQKVFKSDGIDDETGETRWVDDVDAAASKNENGALDKIHIGKVPIMLWSEFCVLKTMNSAVHELNECEYDNVRRVRVVGDLAGRLLHHQRI